MNEVQEERDVEIRMLRLSITGIEPHPEGSMRAFIYNGIAKVAHMNSAELKKWRRIVAVKANEVLCQNRAFLDYPEKDCCYDIHMWFHLLRPKTVKRRWLTVRPDLDKLGRAILDSLGGTKDSGNIVYDDDGKITSLFATKSYVETSEETGVDIIVTRKIDMR